MTKLETLIAYYEKERILLYDKKEVALKSDSTNGYDFLTYQVQYDTVCLFLAQLKEL